MWTKNYFIVSKKLCKNSMVIRHSVEKLSAKKSVMKYISRPTYIHLRNKCRIQVIYQSLAGPMTQNGSTAMLLIILWPTSSAAPHIHWTCPGGYVRGNLLGHSISGGLLQFADLPSGDHTIVPIHTWAHTTVPRHDCAHTRYNRVVTIVSGQKHVRLCPDTYLVPWQADML